MCTAISDNLFRHLFGRTLDLECSYGESVTVTPRHFPLRFLHGGVLNEHLSIIGTAHVRDDSPLYYDAANEAGLCGAALNFPGYAKYRKREEDKENLASAELIPRVLAEFSSVKATVSFLKKVNITDESVSDDLPATPLHWIFSDGVCSITVEQTENGLKIQDNPFGVLTNAPDFSYHTTNLSNYAVLSPNTPKSNICKEKVAFYSRGLGAFGLPGDYSSASRFVRALFAKAHTQGNCGDSISRFFHIMDTVSLPLGTVITDDGKPVSTVYTSCIDTANRTYYFTTYKNRRISAVRLTEELSERNGLVSFSMNRGEDVLLASIPV